MAVGVVVQQAIAQPDDLLGTQSLGEGLFGLGVGPAGVAVAVQHALTRGQDGALTIVIDRAAFQNEVVAGEGRARLLADLVGHFIVVRQVVFTAPAVELERLGCCRCGVKDRARVTQPDVAETTGHHFDAIHTRKARARRLQRLFVADHQLDLLAASTRQRQNQGFNLVLGLF